MLKVILGSRSVVLCMAVAVALVGGAAAALAQTPGLGAVPGSVERAVIVGDAGAVASSGVPGPLVVFGERAFVIACGREGKDARRPVVAGAGWAMGRVIAFGHGGMLGEAALAHAGTRGVVTRGVA